MDLHLGRAFTLQREALNINEIIVHRIAINSNLPPGRAWDFISGNDKSRATKGSAEIQVRHFCLL